MKKILYILSAAICLLTSCEKEKSLADKLVGDWHCSATSTDAEIYATFTAEKTFVLYQQVGEGAFRVIIPSIRTFRSCATCSACWRKRIG